jgi:hypothetical protein
LARRKVILIASATLAVAALGWYLAAAQGDTASGDAGAGGGTAINPTGAAAAASSAANATGGRGPFSAAGLQARQEQLALWRGRYERSEQVYASYRDATRYPHTSRPISEHPDQVRPFDPVSEEKVLRNAKGDAVKGLRLRTTQERVFLSGAETVKFTIEALDDAGQAQPMVVTSAAAQSLPETPTPVALIQTGVEFSDRGTGADEVANDGKYSARLHPAQQGFAGYAGTIRLLAQVSVKGEAGVAHFDVVYTPEVPATWAGVREALEAGALNFYLKVNVVRPGRYVASARVDDAHGVPFALLQFNDEVAAGAREFKLTLFGALVRDRSPAFPLRLRDVDGFLLIPDTFPDRAMMARQSGVVHTSASYGLDRFSPAEWSSEERERYLAEYSRDTETARAQLQRLQGP